MRRHRILPLPLLSFVAAASFIAVLLAPGEGLAAGSHDGHGGHSVSFKTAQQAAFHDQMRQLWEEHVVWTRLAIVSFAAGLPDLSATEQRLLQNQTDIGDAIAPFYGEQAGEQLTQLLKSHILIAVDILGDAKSANTTKLSQDEATWYANANQIADFLSAANPRNWPDSVMRQQMREHLDETLKESVDRLQGDYPADIADFQQVEEHILHMADLLSSGIIKQFPQRFNK